jgi:hypothetical protein
MPNNRRQHYVPQFYLRGFTTGNDDSLFVFDKEQNKIFTKNITEICEERYYYSYEENGEYDLTVEKHLAEKEGIFSEVLKKVVENIENYYYRNGSLLRLTHSERRHLFEFISYQIIRSPYYINKLQSITIPRFERFNQHDGIIQTKKDIINDIKKYSYKNLFNGVEEFNRILEPKNLVFYIVNQAIGVSFASSDNPVIITNSNLLSPIRGALIDPMTEISIPFSKNIALSLIKGAIPNKYNYKLINQTEDIQKMNTLLIKNAVRFAYSGMKQTFEDIKI